MLQVIGKRRSRAFSLIELVIVIVILGVIGAIAIPRMSRGAAGASESGAVSDLAILRSAIELYAAEHNGTFPTVADFSDQLTQYSDIDGNTNATKTAVFMYGPYLRSVPVQKGGPNKGSADITGTQGTAGSGWWYTASTGDVRINAAGTDTDSNGVAWVSY
ncbi:MAG TPA: prepilin-type N-terminal cleavage/methylation domain-containing protein [Phycisphaerales bacterium]|nr:prepilin-type N-terminal cleavage/methylation domain-containing protein [Phycisphaerales bacterium]